MDTSQIAATIQLLGAGAFGAIIGWYVYYINRYRRGDVQFSDLVTVIGVLGGGTILAIFNAQTALFGAYGIGLAIGVLIDSTIVDRRRSTDRRHPHARRRTRTATRVTRRRRRRGGGARPAADRRRPTARQRRRIPSNDDCAL